MDEMCLGNEYYAEPIPTDMLEDITDRRKAHPSINRIEARYKICDRIKKR